MACNQEDFSNDPSAMFGLACFECESFLESARNREIEILRENRLQFLAMREAVDHLIALCYLRAGKPS